MIKRFLPLVVLFLYACAGVRSGQVAYLKINHLREIPQSVYFHYRDYVVGEKAYIMVHPGYYLYFHKKKLDKDEASPELLNFFKEQIKREREFFRFARQGRQLVILVLPGKRLKGEYISYVNRLTGGGENFLYIYSKNHRTGDLPSSEEAVLERFLKAIGVREVIIGGGYVGRCESRTYRDLLSMKGISVALSPEISFFSPNDITEATVRMIKNPDGTLNITVLNRLVQRVFMRERAHLKANIKNLFFNNQSIEE